MKRLILLASLLALALSGQSQNFTTGTWNKVNAKDTLVLSGRALAEVVYSVLVTSKNNEIPTAKAVWDLVQSQIGDKISGTGEAPRVAYFTNNDEIGGDPDLLFDDADNILNVQDIILDGANNQVTAQYFTGEQIDLQGNNSSISIKTTSASSASNGGFISLGNNDGAALANGHQLGKIAFSGNTGAATGNEGATIEAYAEGTYTGSSQPTGIRLSTIPNGSNVGVQRVWLSENGDLSILTGKGLRWWDSDGSNYIELKAPSLSANRSWTLPSDAPANGEVLTWNTGNTLSWEAAGGGSSFYQTWKNNSTAATQRANANFIDNSDIDITLTDDSGNNETEISFDIPAGGVNLSEIENLSTSVLLGNAAIAPGPPLEVGLGTQFFIDGTTLKLDQNSATTGQVYKWSGSVWAPAADGPGISLGTANQIFGINAAGTANEYKTIQGTTNRVNVTHGVGTITLSAPQDLHTDASPQFNSMTLLNTGGNNSLTLQSTVSTSGIYLNAVSPFIYATDIAPSGSNAGMNITFFQNDGAANVSGDRLGYFNFSGRGANSTERISAKFSAFADGSTFTNTSSPGRLVWGTTPSGSTTPVDRVQIRQTGVMEMMSGNELQWWDSDNTNYVGFKVPATGTLTADRSYFLPSDVPTNGQVLTWNTGDILSWESGGGGVTDHGALTGLGDDDHTQYFLLAGRSGGQIATGGTGSGDDLVLRSTTNATKGDVFINDQGGNTILGGGELSNELRFMEPAGSGANYTGFKSGAMGGDQMYTLPIDAPANGEVLTWNTGGGLSWDAVDTNPNDDAPNDVSYVTMANTSSLSNERALASGVNNVRVDGGPNSSVNLDVLSGVSVVSQFTSDQDNYTNSDWSTRTTHTVSSDNGMRAMTGFAALAEGTIRRLINTGTYAMYLPSEHPDSDAANRVGGTGDHILAPNKGVIEMTYIGSRWEVTFNSFNETSLGFKYKGLFYNQVPGSTNQSDQSFIGLTTAGTGAGNQNNPPDDSPNLPQSWGLLTGTTSTGSQTVYFPKNNNAFAAFGGGHLAAFGQIYVPTLSTSGQRYTAQISLTPSANGSTLAVNSSVGIRYSDNVNGGEWEVFTRNSGGSETTGDSNIAVAANTVYTCAIYVDKSLTEARFFITNGTNTYVTRIAATMPASTALAGVRVIGIASVGTTSKQVAVANIGGYIIQP